VLTVDLGGKALTFLQYRDTNMCCYAHPAEIEPEVMRKLILGALRFGKPFVLDMMSLELDHEALTSLFDAVAPGLLNLLLTKRILKEEHYKALIRERDPDEYGEMFWSEETTAHFQFLMVSKLPIPPEWCAESFFVLRVSG
jgi:hypothetical protein